VVALSLTRLSSRPVQGPGNLDPAGPAGAGADVDASRRTYLASERTQLAWWRTGLTSIAVALGVGRVVPELSDTGTRWPYVAVGAGFAVYGVAMIAYGTWRARSVYAALQAGRFADAPDRLLAALTVAGIVLGALTVVLVIAD
jgi:putative membrane protein